MISLSRNVLMFYLFVNVNDFSGLSLWGWNTKGEILYLLNPVMGLCD